MLVYFSFFWLLRFLLSYILTEICPFCAPFYAFLFFHVFLSTVPFPFFLSFYILSYVSPSFTFLLYFSCITPYLLVFFLSRSALFLIVSFFYLSYLRCGSGFIRVCKSGSGKKAWILIQTLWIPDLQQQHCCFFLLPLSLLPLAPLCKSFHFQICPFSYFSFYF